MCDQHFAPRKVFRDCSVTHILIKTKYFVKIILLKYFNLPKDSKFGGIMKVFQQAYIKIFSFDYMYIAMFRKSFVPFPSHTLKTSDMIIFVSLRFTS